MRSPVLVAVGLVVVVIAGCAPVVERARSAPVAAPAFASEEEALEAATEAYARYVEVGDEIARNGGVGAQELAEVAVGSFLEKELADLEAFRIAGKHQTGGTEFRDVVIQSYFDSTVLAYLCDDISMVDIVNSAGVSVVSSDRPDTNYFQVEFLLGLDGNLRVAGVERWDDRKC